MKKIILIITILSLYISLRSQTNNSISFSIEKDKIQKQIKKILHTNVEILSDSCQNTILYFIFIRNSKNTKLLIQGDKELIVNLIEIRKEDSIFINWKNLNSNEKYQAIIQPIFIKCEKEKNKELLISANNFIYLFKCDPLIIGAKVTLFDPIDELIASVRNN